MTRPPLELLLENWRATATLCAASSESSCLMLVEHRHELTGEARALNRCADQLESALRAQAEAGAGQQDESTPADALEAAYERFSDKFLVRYPFVAEDQHFMVPHDAAEAFTQAMEQGVAAFRAALGQAWAGGDTVEGVMAAVKAANRRGGREPADVPTEEYEARLDVIDTGRAYASALVQLDCLQEQRTAFHAAQGRLAAALAQADAADAADAGGAGAGGAG
ncbi:hypothetical protein ACMT4L_16785 [Deinococcus sp. A31D244]|uniref:hypothetical protein n=1 Tax=Deinococcus sp. A31D244 TaxID=3397675 RepID=UPI0039E1340A